MHLERLCIDSLALWRHCFLQKETEEFKEAYDHRRVLKNRAGKGEKFRQRSQLSNWEVDPQTVELSR